MCYRGHDVKSIGWLGGVSEVDQEGRLVPEIGGQKVP